MTYFELVLLALALAMDAFAVSISEGIRMKRLLRRHALKTALLFGFFQALMPSIGYFAGVKVHTYLESMDHWVALALLSFIGVRMIREACRMRPLCRKPPPVSGNRELLILSLATSVDALAAGISLSIQHANILICAAVIGGVTFACCFIGVMLGQKLGCVFQKRAEIFGGAALILLGVKILLEHLCG